jgi:acetylornithine deacetylase/succinyl-diaminopimelate desuccinylase-like protein
MTIDSDRALERLRELCRIPTVTSDRERVGDGADWLVDTYGAGCELVEAHCDEAGAVAGLLLCFRGRERDRLTFFNYLDVTAPGTDSRWEADPFSAELRNGRIYGRGTASNKGDLIARLEAVDQLRAHGRLRRDVVFWIDAAEEQGSPRLGEMLARWRDQLAAGLVIWNTGFVNPSGEPLVGFGFKGVVIAELSVDVDSLAGHSGFGVGTSAVHRLFSLLGPLLDSDDLECYLGGEQAAYRSQEELRQAARSGIAAMAAGDDGSESLATRALLRSTANVPWFEGGRSDALTRYAGKARCALELRLAPPSDARRAFEALVSHCARAHVECKALMQLEPYALDGAGRIAAFNAVSPALSAAFARSPKVLPVAPFSARAQEVAETLGASVISVGLTDPQSAPHAPDESISEELFVRMTEFVARLVGTVGTS